MIPRGAPMASTTVSAPKPVYRRDALVCACMAALVAYGLFIYSIGGIMAFLRQESGGSLVMVGRFGSAVASGTLAAGLLYSRRTSPRARRGYVLLAAAGFVAAVPMVVLLPDWWAVGAAFLAGTFGSIIQAALFAALGTMRPDHTAQVLVEANLAAVVPSLIAPLALSAADTLLGSWRWSMALPAILLLAVLRPVLNAVRLSPESTPERPTRQGRSWTPVLMLCCAVLSFASAFEFGINYFLPSLLQSAGSLEAAEATSIAGYFGFGLILGRLAGVLIARRRPVSIRVLVAAFASATVTGGLLALTPQLPLGAILTVLVGFSAANLYPFAMAFAFRVSGEDPHIVAGRSQVFVGALVAAAPAVLAVVADAVSVRVGMVVPIGLAAIAIAVVVILGRRTSHE